METFTPQRLLDIAIEAEAKYEERSKLFPAGTYDKERNDAFDLVERAQLCAAWMEREGIKELTHVGPFGELPVRQGQRVRIKKGAVIRSTHPQTPKGGIVAERAQVVTVHSIDRGYVDRAEGYRDGAPAVRQPKVHWAGAGGYWRWTDATNIDWSYAVEDKPGALAKPGLKLESGSLAPVDAADVEHFDLTWAPRWTKPRL